LRPLPPGLTGRIFQGLSLLVAVIILLQAALAGHFLYREPGALEIHEMMGNTLFIIVIAQVATAVVLRRAAYRLFLLTSLLLFLVVAQIGLGYLGRESSWAASLHITAGVFIFGLASVILVLTLQRDWRAAEAGPTSGR
jgi:cytochrome b561